MAGLIPRDFIEDLIARVDIVEVVGGRVQLKKSGREFSACCPFHGEKTPSFYVSPQKQFYHCFGCGAHGNALGFLMEYEHMEFVEAVEDLARLVGVEVPREGGGQKRERAEPDLYAVLEEAANFYRRALKDDDTAVEYLKQRGLTGEIVAEYGIGWAPGGWDALTKALGGGDAKRTLLERAGMLARKDDRVYDRFRERVMFPIRDARGRTIAFGGRVIGGGEPKYLNSPETPVFHKGRELYGLYETKQVMRDIPRMLVVEGYMDVVALAQHGIRYAVATLGTATTADHLHRLFRVAPEVVFCFDGDSAGRAAAWRALEQALPECKEGRQLRFLFLPDGEDPDSMVRKEGAEAFERRVAKATPLSEFMLDSLSAQVDMESLDGRARLVELARPMFARVPDGVFRHLLVEALGGRAHIAAPDLEGLVGPSVGQAPSRRPVRRPATGRTRISAVRSAIELLLHQPQLATLVDDPHQLAELDQPGAELLSELVAWCQAHPNATAATITEHWRGTEHETALAKLARAEVPADGLEAQFRDLLARLAGRDRRTRTERRIAELSARPLKSLTDAEKAELRALHGELKR